MALAWMELDLRDDPDEARFVGDPGLLIEALADLYAILEPPDWHSRASCRGKGSAIFYTRQGEDVRPAKAICAGCPVAAECLADALSHGAIGCDHGIWGGTSAKERKRMRRTSTIVDTAA